MFFFEKKNQKTFTHLAKRPPGTRLKNQKFFASFFPKKKAFLLSFFV
jgi:hypothetical protein